MLRFSLITLRSFLNSSTSTNKRKLISFPFNNTTLKCNFYACQKNLKKQGQWSKDDKSDETVKKSVKLYPGFQESIEEKSSKQINGEISAKQVIEDFYGLNELEFDEIEEKELQEEELHSSNVKLNFDLDYVVKALRNENVQDLFCIEIPKEINYADYIVIGTCLSEKHLNSTFFSINRKYKNLKNDKYNYVQRKAGKETKWCALDTGKVVINLFLEDQRKYYDLESLWSCGIEFDEKYIEFTKNKSEIEKRLIVPDEEQTNQN